MRAGCGLVVSIPSRARPASRPVTPIAPSVTQSRKSYWVPTCGAAVSPHPLRLPRDAAYQLTSLASGRGPGESAHGAAGMLNYQPSLHGQS